jgi:hypothetical protein
MDSLAWRGAETLKVHFVRRIARVLTTLMSQPVAERVKRLRDEIAEISQANRAYVRDPKYVSAVAAHERRLQRLLEIVDELKSLTEWKKL